MRSESAALQSRPTKQLPGQAIETQLASGDHLRITAVAPAIFRVQLSRDGKFLESLLERYDIVRREWPQVDCEISRSENNIAVETSAGSIFADTKTGTLGLRDDEGEILVEKILPLASQLEKSQRQAYTERQRWLQNFFQYSKKSGVTHILGETGQAKEYPYVEKLITDESLRRFGATFRLRDDERFYGLGSASKRRIQLRGHAYRNWVEYRKRRGFDPNSALWEQTNGPVPFLMSTGGWALFINTTWLHYVDVGRYEPDEMFFWGPGGDLDFYLMVGVTLPQLLDRYTDITGKPVVLPQWAYGLNFVGHRDIDQFEMLRQASLFREHDIPCDVFALEPGWMEKNYDYSQNKKWSSKRFMLVWQPRVQSFIGALDRMGFKLWLWLCCDEDLSQEEERQIAIREGRPQDVPSAPHAWFDHLNKFVDNGVVGFKLDPAKLIYENPEREYYNGRSDFEMHLMNQVLLLKQMNLGFAKRGIRGFNHYCCKYAGTQRWGATTTGDNEGGAASLCWELSQGLSGHMNTSSDMSVMQRREEDWPDGAGLHKAFLGGWTQQNNWASSWEPWYLGSRLMPMYRDYAKLRYRLLPYIYSAAHNGAKTGMPIVRAMPLMFQEDLKCADLTTQYMFGEWMLSAVFTDTVYLPQGRWIDYWTGEAYEGPMELKMDVPENRGGGLFVRAGAIIPTWPERAYVGEPSTGVMGLDVFPSGSSSFTIYEDDGNTYNYLDGELDSTKIYCQQDAKKIELEVGPREGNYAGMPERRSFELRMRVELPQEVTLNGKVMPRSEDGWQFDSEEGVLSVLVAQDVESQRPIRLIITR